MMRDGVQAIVIGGSAGSLEALSAILPALPADLPVPMFAVVHLPADKPSVLVELLQNKSTLAIREARDKEPVEPGTVYFAPPDYHLLVEAGHYLSLSCDEPRMFSRPSIDVLFESAADVYGPHLLGVVLSGANSDGAHGLRAIVAEGGRAVVQAPFGAYAAAMPEAALAACPGAECLPLAGIAEFLRREVLG